MPDSRITKIIFKWSITKKNVWTRQIEKIFEDANAGFIFRNVLTCSVSDIREKHFECYKQRWANEIFCKPKL